MTPSPRWPEGLPTHLACPERSVYANLEAVAAERPNAVATIFYGGLLRYAELKDHVDRLCAHLQHACGVKRGDRVLLDMQNSPQYIASYYAILRADAVVVPVNPMNMARELRYLAEDSGARVALIGAELLERFAALHGDVLDHLVVARYGDLVPADCGYALPEVVAAAPVVLPATAGLHAWTDAVQTEAAPLPHLAQPDDVCLQPYTSGTTGHPKGCVHTHRSVMFTAVAQAVWYDMTPDSVVTAVQPLFHVAGMQGSMNAGIYAGSAMLVMARWDRDLVPQLFEDFGVTFWNAAPTMVVDVMASPRFSERAFATLRTLTGGGAAMPQAVAAQLRERFGLEFCEGYGMTETMSPTHINPPAHPKRQCLGIAIFDTDARVIDPATLAELPAGEVGEIIVSGPQVLRSYWNRPDADAEAFINIDGKRFLRTGDMGRCDDEGYFFAVDRIKRMINASGFKVWPAEVEAMMYEHPAIRECCVVAARDERRGETVKAFVVLHDYAQGSVDAQALIDWARATMASYKAPRIVEFASALPRSGSNKIDWRSLQDAPPAAAA
ncbi:long-chain fatty acid--CoA ligase [soil metagenome]